MRSQQEWAYELLGEVDVPYLLFGDLERVCQESPIGAALITSERKVVLIVWYGIQ